MIYDKRSVISCLQSGLTVNRVGSFDNCVEMPAIVTCNDCDLRDQRLGPMVTDL